MMKKPSPKCANRQQYPQSGANWSQRTRRRQRGGFLGHHAARIHLDSQTLRAPDGVALSLSAGMQVTAEIHQGRRTVMEYLLSPLQKYESEAAGKR